MNGTTGVGLDLDDVLQRAADGATEKLVARPAVHLSLPPEPAVRRNRPFVVPGRFAEAALRLAEADACALVRPKLSDTLALWREAAQRELPRDEAEAFRGHLSELLEDLEAGGRPRIAVAIPDPSTEEAQERWLRLLAGIGHIDPVWRPVLAALGLAARANGVRHSSFTLLAVEVGWGVLRANVLKVERDPQTGLHVPERRRPGEEIAWDGPAPPPPERRIALAWTRRRDGVLVRTAPARTVLPAEMAAKVEEAAGELGEALEDRLAGAAPVVWLVEGALAGAPCGPGRLGGAVVRGLRRVLPDPADIVLADAAEGLVARGGAECARRLAQDLPAWWDALPQLEINRVDRQGIVTFVPLVDAPRIAGGSTYTNVVGGFRLPSGAPQMLFVLLRSDHDTARQLEQPLPRRLPREIPVRLQVRQKPARGRARVDVVPVEPTPDFPPVKLDWELLRETGWTREEALRELQGRAGLRFPPKTPVPAGLHHWRETALPQVLARFLELRPAQHHLAYLRAVKDCMEALRARRPPDGRQRVGVVSSDGEVHQALRPDERELLERFREKLDRDIRALPWGDDTRRRLVVAGAWLYAAAPAAVREDLQLALEESDYRRGFVQAAGRCLAEEDEVRLFFERCAEAFGSGGGNTDWAKALGQILLYREDACLWVDADLARLCLDGSARELQRALQRRGELRPQIFNNAILALLGLLRVRRHLPDFLFGRGDDPVPCKVGHEIRGSLGDLADELDRAYDRTRAEKVREVVKFVEGRGSDMLIGSDFDQD